MFSSKILERGYDYWAEGLVSDVLSTEDGYEAIVSGSYNYEVEIIVDDDEVLEMYCDCPYAEEGRYCKHMAAVLYELTNQCMAAGILIPHVSGKKKGHTESRNEGYTEFINLRNRK